MTVRNRLMLLCVLPALLAGCATTTNSSAPVPASDGSMAPGMVMPSGMTMPGMSPTASDGSGPSQSAQMVCGPEISNDVSTILGLAAPASTTSTWADSLFTCTYALSGGPLVLSVKESPDVATANTYFTTLGHSLGVTRPLTGMANLGTSAYETSTGTVVVLKDAKTLRVDATRFPAAVGPHHLSATDFAYELATDILGCWNGK